MAYARTECLGRFGETRRLHPFASARLGGAPHALPHEQLAAVSSMLLQTWNQTSNFTLEGMPHPFDMSDVQCNPVRWFPGIAESRHFRRAKQALNRNWNLCLELESPSKSDVPMSGIRKHPWIRGVPSFVKKSFTWNDQQRNHQKV